MDTHHDPVRITFRIPGTWEHPGELLDRLPAGYRVTSEDMWLPDGTHLDFIPMPPDEQFAGVFESSCRREPAPEELDEVRRYQVNIGLSGPGGSLDAARTMMQAASAIIAAGGAGVFIDNCVLSHGAADWLDMTDDGSPDAVSFAFVNVIRGGGEMWTMGMHALGFPDLALQVTDPDLNRQSIADVIRFICAGDHRIRAGDLLIDSRRRFRFQTSAERSDPAPAGSPLHNPFGRLRLNPLKTVQQVAEEN